MFIILIKKLYRRIINIIFNVLKIIIFDIYKFSKINKKLIIIFLLSIKSTNKCYN